MENPNPSGSASQFKPPRRIRRWWWLAGAITLIVVGAGLIIYPFIPALRYAIVKPQPTLPYQTRLTSDDAQKNVLDALPQLPAIENKPIPTDNRIVIPSINVDMPIYEGPDEKTLNRGGIWHIPKTSDPVRGGNFVLSGHRWQYLPPSSLTLYLLDKVQDNEPIIVYWEGVEYDYQVSGRDIVKPYRVDILEDTPQPRLTIFTCNPVFSTRERLVLYATLI